jgi:hypothetical protein
LLNSRLDGLVVFNGGGEGEEELAERARARGVTMRVVDSRAILAGPQ